MPRMIRTKTQGNDASWWISTIAAAVLLVFVMPVSAQDEQPVTEGEKADESQQQDEVLAADQAALESELASAKRFEAELDALLLADGTLDTTRENAQLKLGSLATRCGILANSALHDEVKLVLLGYHARALAALASLQPEGQNQDRMEQLNDVAQQMAAIDLPGATAAADYWLLVADMAAPASSKQSPTRRQAGIERALVSFIKAHEGEPAAAEYLLDTRLSLMQLMDQRGAQQDALKQLSHIGTLPEDSPRLGEAKRLRESIARLGTPIAFDSISTELNEWRSSDHLGKPVLIHVYADRVAPSVRMIDVISRRIVSGSLGGISLVSLRVGEPVAGSSAPPWPTLPVQLERGGILDQLGVTALPTLVWLDGEGRLASIGTTAAVLNQLKNLQVEDANEPVDQAEADSSVEQAPSQEEPDAEQGADVTPSEN